MCAPSGHIEAGSSRDLAGHADSRIRVCVAGDEPAEEPIPDGEDRGEVLLAGSRDVVETVKPWRDEHRLQPSRANSQVAVPVERESCVDDEGERYRRGWHAEREERCLGSDLTNQVLEHVSASCRQPVELQARVMDLVHRPEHLESVEPDVHGEGDEVVQDDGDAETGRPWEAVDRLGESRDAQP